MTLTEQLKQQATSLGFTSVGACPAVQPNGVHQLYEWIDLGYAGSMDYIRNRADAYADPNYVLPGARSLLMLAMNYQTEPPVESSPGEARVSRYAWGNLDYHDIIHKRLKQMVRWLKQQAPGSQARGVVDSAPLMEREFAQMAGLGWVGKHTLLIHPKQGSWFFLAAILTDLILDYDAPFETDHCGSCRACLDACPTDAFPQPFVLDATRCISYLTIENRESIPDDLASHMGEWVFGCDICQEVCPWNRRAPHSSEPGFQPRDDLNGLNLIELLDVTDDQFRELYRRTPLWRAKRRGLLRNAAIAIGNQRLVEALPALHRTKQDQDEVVGAACEWAIRQIEAAGHCNR